jgi:Holliday junction resolvase-like predicted endonuclease
MSQPKYAQQDELGRFGENVVAYWLQSRGNSVVPLRDIETGDIFKGPRMTGPEGIEGACTDWLCTNRVKTVFIEVKTKRAFSWHRLRADWVTGIDQHYAEHYMMQRKNSSIPMWLLFLHLYPTPSDSDREHGCPDQCPTGLYGQEILVLANDIHHTSPNWGKGGMVYWSFPPLLKLETLEGLQPFIEKAAKAAKR